jgi:Flp pilus assembly protein TadG
MFSFEGIFMHNRRKTSGGQAIVMVTLSLISMVGMMGLAIDLGWSYFVQKQAQSAADSAALAAAQAAVQRLGSSTNISGFKCPTNSGVTCTDSGSSPVITPCSSVGTATNLYDGCLYAKNNGFDGTTGGTNPIVTMQSGDASDTNAPPGVKRMSYWVRVRVIKTIPQLFSYSATSQKGTVAANATAGIAGSIQPGNFYGMNHAGDCWSLPGAAPVNCGMDLNANSTGKAKTACPGSGGGSGQACAPAGIFLSSSCNSSSSGGSNCSQAWYGSATTGNGVETSALVLYGDGTASKSGAVVGSWHDAAGNAVSPQYSTGTSNTQDPTYGKSQPPLQTNNTIPSCGLKGGTLSGTAGPFQYYSYTNKDLSGKPIPDGGPINISGSVTFTNTSSAATCPGGANSYLSGGLNQSGSFNTFVFYGGVNVSGTMNLTSGQYVLAGVANGGAANGLVLTSPNNGGTIQAGDASASTTGSMFIFTDGSYPGLGGPKSQGNNSGTGQISAVPNWDQMPALYQGSINVKNSNITMDGLVNSSVGGSGLPSTMNAYSGIVWWQDRRNSMVEYNQCTSSLSCTNPTLAPNCGALCTKDDGSVVACADQSAGQCSASQTTGEIVTDNHVTSTSPGVTIDPGRGSMSVNGVFYQPRGAWAQLIHGTGFGTGNLQVLTGSLDLSSGDDRFLLQGPTNPLITYKAVLIQ